MLAWFANWRRQRLLKRYAFADAAWQAALAPYPFFDRLSADETRRLRELVALFCAEKEFVAGGAKDDALQITLETQLMIAAQACLPILNLDLAFYSGWHGIIVYRGEVRVQRQEMDEDGVVHVYDDVISGEAMPGGPVVLSWADVTLAGSDEAPAYSVVIHEFAHKIDMLKGDATGVPPFAPQFHGAINGRAFEAALMKGYEAFAAEVESWVRNGEPEEEAPRIDPYAAEHPSEFFAVLSEAFFTQPEDVFDEFPELYALLKAYYRQDPITGCMR